MIKIKARFILSLLALITFSQISSASVTLLDKDDWKFLFGGFVELDMFNDSTRSFTEVAGNNPVQRSATYAGDNGYTQFSLRNSRFAFTLLPPVQDDWKTKGYLEFDLLGYDPAPAASGTTNAESSFYTNPTLRLRHGYLSAEKNNWSVLAGQTWTLFGWNPYYVLTTASVPPVSGSVYERTPQITVIKALTLNDTDKLQLGLSINRPVQRDSTYPGLDAGARWLIGSRRAGFASPSGDIAAEPMSFALSGTMRQFEIANVNGQTTDMNRFTGGAIAADTLIPILASSDGKATGNTLSFTGEFTSGMGYGDEFPGWSGNLTQFALGSTIPASGTAIANLDAGQAGFDGAGNFQLVRIQTFTGQLQYHFDSEAHTFIGAGYGQLYSMNLANLNPVSSGKVLYDKPEVIFGNIFHDYTKNIRVALEYARFSTHYVDSLQVVDNRYQVSAWFRF